VNSYDILPTNRAEIRNAWADYLTQFAWDAMFTCTFKKEYRGAARGPQTAIDMVYNHLPCADRHIIFAESHRLGGFHCHGLLYAGGSPACDDVLPCAEENLRALGWSRMERIDSVGAVSAYCVKYLAKTGGDYRITGTPEQWDYVRGLGSEGFGQKMDL
jgi:hypothetical protein